jgi:hypothetical protein
MLSCLVYSVRRAVAVVMAAVEVLVVGTAAVFFAARSLELVLAPCRAGRGPSGHGISSRAASASATLYLMPRSFLT